MYLKSLEIQGFKSFPDKTVLQFGSDITAIVGPNGSGKSNISDAISWVLGEQSSRALRGAKMEDVIFGGTQKRAPVGYAEATLVLDNQAGQLRIETPEVAITRRYYRSGESEYFINRQSARLRDINELLMDTGLGREGYSNIGQGKVDEILSLKSTDRREVFEEAAGISKYRHRKEETERRLANTEDNLLRIGDKISELELQVEPLREQAEKAKKYLALRDELKGLEVTVWLDGLSKAAEHAKKAEADYASAAFILEQAHDELTRLYSASEQLSLQFNQETLQLDQLREEISGLESDRQRQEGEAAVLAASITHQNENIVRIRQELDDQDTRSGGIAGSIAEQKQRMEAAQAAMRELNAEIGALAAKNAEFDRETAEKQNKLLALQTKQSVLQADAAEKNTQIASLTASLSEVQERQNILKEDRAAAEARRADIDARQAECRRRLAQAQEDVTSAKNTISGYELRLKTRQDKRIQLQKQTDTADVQLQTIEARMKMLREMEREFEGFSKAVRLVMQDAERGNLRGVRGPVSKLIRVDDEFTTAIETALGAAMQNIVVENEDCGKAAIQMLKRRDGGRATFLPMNTIHGKRMSLNGLERQPGFVGIASALVETAPEYGEILENLLGRTVIAETLDQAIRMARAGENRFRIVTLDGQVMNAGGSMTGGSTTKSAGVLSRANDLARLEGERARQAQQLESLQKQLNEAASSAAKTEFELSTVRQQLREAEDEVLRRTEEEKQAAALRDAMEANLASIDAELKRIEARNGGDGGRLDMLREQREQLDAQLAALEAELSAAQSALEAAGAQQTALNEKTAQLRMELAAKDAERSGAETSIAQLEALAEAMAGDREQKLHLIEDCNAQIAALREQQAAQAAAVNALAAQTEEKRSALQAAVEHRTQLEGRRNQTEKQAQDKNKEILNLERETARLEQRKLTSEMEEKQLIDKLWDSYELTPSTAEAEKIEIESIPAANKKITETRRKISSLGTPNLGAIDEFARVNERYEYLTGQRDDVLHAKDDLLQIIDGLTTEMTEIFVREFAKINEYFGATFTEMFGGGRASLELEDKTQPLTCGIEIRVQPPGKQLKTITLLSGGEKAFVAIALYFAILKVRPTPFCMLDEIDAALDDRNVGRFAGYLRNLCEKTQFIVITHRRGTMEAADVLYGVTMQEQGVSKILSLDLDEMSKQLGITA